MSTVLYTLLSVALVSLVSLVGVLVIFFKQKDFSQTNHFLIGLAIGALLAGAFVHLLPEAMHTMEQMQFSIFLLIGILFFFLFEKFLHWKLKKSQTKIAVFGPINLVADFFHNFLDGVLIALAFQMDIQVGIAATIAIVLHELPQEFGDFGVLIKAGYTVKRALLFNLYSSLSAFLGAFLILLIPGTLKQFIPYLYPISIAAFIYLALTNLMPELQKQNSKRILALQLAGIVMGMTLLILLLIFNSEHHHHHH